MSGIRNGQKGRREKGEEGRRAPWGKGAFRIEAKCTEGVWEIKKKPNILLNSP